MKSPEKQLDVMNVRSWYCGQQAKRPQVAPAELDGFRGDWPLTCSPTFREGGEGFRVLRKLFLGQLNREIVLLEQLRARAHKR